MVLFPVCRGAIHCAQYQGSSDPGVMNHAPTGCGVQGVPVGRPYNMVVFLLALFLCGALFAAEKPVKPAAEPMVITAQEAKEKFFGKSDVVFIDNRPDAKFCDGRIPGAVNLIYFAPGSAENRMTKESLKPYAGKKLVFYCSGKDRAKHAVETARSWGIDPKLIFWLKEGFPVWRQKGYPVEKMEDACPI